MALPHCQGKEIPELYLYVENNWQLKAVICCLWAGNNCQPRQQRCHCCSSNWDYGALSIFISKWVSHKQQGSLSSSRRLRLVTNCCSWWLSVEGCAWRGRCTSFSAKVKTLCFCRIPHIPLSISPEQEAIIAKCQKSKWQQKWCTVIVCVLVLGRQPALMCDLFLYI